MFISTDSVSEISRSFPYTYDKDITTTGSTLGFKAGRVGGTLLRKKKLSQKPPHLATNR